MQSLSDVDGEESRTGDALPPSTVSYRTIGGAVGLWDDLAIEKYTQVGPQF